MKRRICQSCESLATCYERESWCRREDEVAILKRTEEAIMKGERGVKLIGKRYGKNLEICLDGKKFLTDQPQRMECGALGLL